eukprot:COSAG06_NODE_227_length_19736_cov_15.570708_14_plen_105_part_00
MVSPGGGLQAIPRDALVGIWTPGGSVWSDWDTDLAARVGWDWWRTGAGAGGWLTSGLQLLGVSLFNLEVFRGRDHHKKAALIMPNASTARTRTPKLGPLRSPQG